MGVKNYNWVGLYYKYLVSKNDSVKTFLLQLGVRYNSYARKKTTGWKKKKEVYNLSTLQRAFENNELKIVKLRERQILQAQKIQLKGLKTLHSKKIRSVEEARKFILYGMREERSALLFTNPHVCDCTKAHLTLLKAICKNLSYVDTLKLLSRVREEIKTRVNKIS